MQRSLAGLIQAAFDPLDVPDTERDLPRTEFGNGPAGDAQGEQAIKVRLANAERGGFRFRRSEEHTSELQSLMRISYAVFCLKKKTNPKIARKASMRRTYTSRHSASALMLHTHHYNYRIQR